MRARYGYSRRTSEYREHWYTFVPWSGILTILAVGAVTGLVVWLIFLAVQEQARWEEWCWDQDGRVDSSTSLGHTYVDGKMVTTTSTTYYCLTEDGRVLDIKG